MTRLLLFSALALATLSAASAADSGCDGFQWNVTRERALFAMPPTSLRSAPEPASAPPLSAGVLYELAVAPQDGLHLVAAPGKHASFDGAHGGFALLQVPSPGLWRIALSEAGWIDVIASGQTLAARDFQGQHDCAAPRKVVEFELPAGNAVLQLTGIRSQSIRIALTAAPSA